MADRKKEKYLIGMHPFILITFLFNTAFVLWVCKYRGAEWLEGRFISAHPQASADGLKIIAAVEYAIHLILFICSFFSQAAREWLLFRY